MRDGTKIRIKDMTDEHLTNTLKMLDKNAVKMYLGYQAEGYRLLAGIRGEMAELCIESDLNSMTEEEFLPEIWDDLLADAHRRGLKIKGQWKRIIA
jgi:hypothetical protein